MNYYFAPLEGLTDWVYRRLHHRYFPGITRYFTPFLSPTVHHKLTSREAKELPPADTLQYTSVPQVLTRVSEDFLWLAEQAKALGYQEINLNLGCPSGTVTAKGKGSCMLADLDSLDAFLCDIFTSAPLDISVKTRIGFHSAEEFPAVLDIFNQYPIKELTVHSRVRKDFYNGQPDMETFAYAMKNSKNPICYNGNLNTISQIKEIQQRFPQLKSVMLGRGLIADPGMLSPGGTTVATLEAFHNELLEEYLVLFGGSRNAMFRLKENWRYLMCHFDGDEKLTKRLRKTTDLAEYKAITQEIFRTLPLKKELTPDW